MTRDSEYIPPVLDRGSWLLLVLSWVACAGDVSLAVLEVSGSGALAGVLIADTVAYVAAIWALIRSREPVLGRPHWLTIANFFFINALLWAPVFFQ